MTTQDLVIPTNLLEYEGDLLKAEVDAILHQTNCMSNGCSGIAAAIFEQVPEANTYRLNPQPGLYGTQISFNVVGKPFKMVVNLYAQLYPGRAGYGNDSAGLRLIRFEQSLDNFLTTMGPAITSLAFPKYIGCGLAGGDWNSYRKIILERALYYPHVTFHIIEKKSSGIS